LMTIFGAVVHSGAGFDEDVFHVCQFRDLGLSRNDAISLSRAENRPRMIQIWTRDGRIGSASSKRNALTLFT
jgi:hypothetical protein